MFCPQAVTWGRASDIAGVVVGSVAAAATIWAVIVALKANRKAFETAMAIRADERAEAQEIRKLKAKAYASVFVDELGKAESHLRIAAEQMDACLAEGNATRKHAIGVVALRELNDISPDGLMRVLDSIEVFEDPLGKSLARLAITTLQSKQIAERNVALATTQGQLLGDAFFSEVRDSIFLRAHQIKLAAPGLYDVAGITADNRKIKPITDSERNRYRELAAQR